MWGDITRETNLNVNLKSKIRGNKQNDYYPALCFDRSLTDTKIETGEWIVIWTEIKIPVLGLQPEEGDECCQVGAHIRGQVQSPAYGNCGDFTLNGMKKSLGHTIVLRVIKEILQSEPGRVEQTLGSVKNNRRIDLN